MYGAVAALIEYFRKMIEIIVEIFKTARSNST